MFVSLYQWKVTKIILNTMVGCHLRNKYLPMFLMLWMKRPYQMNVYILLKTMQKSWLKIYGTRFLSLLLQTNVQKYSIIQVPQVSN